MCIAKHGVYRKHVVGVQQIGFTPPVDLIHAGRVRFGGLVIMHGLGRIAMRRCERIQTVQEHEDSQISNSLSQEPGSCQMVFTTLVRDSSRHLFLERISQGFFSRVAQPSRRLSARNNRTMRVYACPRR